MTIVDLTVFVLTVWGVVYLTTSSVIFSPVRLAVLVRTAHSPLTRVFTYCPKCQAFWIGLALGLVVQYAPGVLWGDAVPPSWLEFAPRAWVLAFAAMGSTAACAPLSTWATEAYTTELELVTLEKDA